MFRNLLNSMDVNPSLRLEEHLKAADLFDLVSCAEYDLSGTGIGSDWGGLDDIVGRTVNNNNVTVGDMEQAWSSGSYQDPPTPTSPPLGVHHSLNKDKDTSDQMWGGGCTTEKVVNSTTGNTILITFPPMDTTHSVPTTSDAAQNSSPLMMKHNNLDLFNSILNEKPHDVLLSHKYSSTAPASISYGNACSGYNDSRMTSSLEDTASPSRGDYHRLVDSTVDSLVYSPAADGSLGQGFRTNRDGNSYFPTNTKNLPYAMPVTQSNEVSSILEGALRGAVRRPGGPSQPISQLPKLKEPKTFTVMSNMTPLPQLMTTIKAEQLNTIAGSTQISSTSGMYTTTGYDYHTPPPEKFESLDDPYTKLSPDTTNKVNGTSVSSTKPKKRKYTNRPQGYEPTAKGRLLHFCHICNKGFKDKYNVNVHVRTHTGEKPFNCEVCGKCFRQKAHLGKHVHVHTAPKPAGKR